MIPIAKYAILGLIMVNVVLVSMAQLFLKIGANQIKTLAIVNSEHLIMSVFKVAFNPYVFFGTSCYVASLVLWIYILTKSQLSLAYPLMSLSYVTVLLFSIFFINEKVNFIQWIGVILIVVGTSLVFAYK